MPGNIETFVKCAGPDKARPMTRIGGVVGSLLGILDMKLLLVVLSMGFFVWLMLTKGLAVLLLLCYLAPIVIIGAAETKHWYYNERLLCLRENDCAIGILIDNVDAATDGDRKLNLLPAPMHPADVHKTLSDLIAGSATMLTDPANFKEVFLPQPPALDLAKIFTFEGLRDYIRALGTAGPDGDERSFVFDQLSVALIDTLMKIPGFSTYERYLRRLPAAIPDTTTFNFMPVDFAPPDSGTWQTPNAMNTKKFFNAVEQREEFLNPLFRIDRDRALPFLHCEIDGHQVAIWCDDAIVTASAILGGCIAFGPVGGAAAGALAWLFKKFFDWLTGNDGDAGKPNVEWDDPNAEIQQTPDPFGFDGDVIAVYGNPVMDCEHRQWFEIHPVRAYYVLANAGSGFTQHDASVKDVSQRITPDMITPDVAVSICQVIHQSENPLELGEISMGSTKAQSLGMGTTWGNGDQRDNDEPPEIH